MNEFLLKTNKIAFQSIIIFLAFLHFIEDIFENHPIFPNTHTLDDDQFYDYFIE